MEEEWIEYDGGVVQDWHRSARRIRVAQGVAVIPEHAFENCEDLIAVDLGNVATISDGAFFECLSLERVVWTTASTVEIGIGAFAFCTSLREIRRQLCRRRHSLLWSDLSNATKVGAGAFYRCEALTSVAIPSSAVFIEESAFRGCKNLTDVKLGEGVQRIGESAFLECSALVRITVPPSVTDIEAWAFSECSSLAEVELNEGLQQIGEGAFQICASLQSIGIPSSVLKVGRYAFAGCNQLKHAALQDGLEMIGPGPRDDGAPNFVKAFGTFQDCYSLERITIPSSVMLVGSDAFYDCHNLAEVTLREGLHCIEDRAFGSCPALEHINISPSVALVISLCDWNRAYSCQLMRTTIPKTIRGRKLVVSKWMQYRSSSQLAFVEAKVNEILRRRQLTAEEKIQCIRIGSSTTIYWM